MTTTAPGRTNILLTVMLVVSVALNVGLAYKVRSFASAQEAQLARLEERRLKSGTKVPAISARRVDTTDGIVETIRYSDTNRPTVLYILSPTCGWCAKNVESLKTLIAETRNEYRFLAISLTAEGIEKYASDSALGIPLYTSISEEAKQAYRMGGTPQTIVVSPSGVVTANWAGAYLGTQKEAVEKFFRVNLPEIALDKRS